jgi:hypothetical protein
VVLAGLSPKPPTFPFPQTAGYPRKKNERMENYFLIFSNFLGKNFWAKPRSLKNGFVVPKFWGKFPPALPKLSLLHRIRMSYLSGRELVEGHQYEIYKPSHDGVSRVIEYVGIYDGFQDVNGEDGRVFVSFGRKNGGRKTDELLLDNDISVRDIDLRSRANTDYRIKESISPVMSEGQVRVPGSMPPSGGRRKSGRKSRGGRGCAKNRRKTRRI